MAPHMFYQACRVAGKNSTPCKERKDDGTVVIEIDLEPSKNWQVTCDCVGILKVSKIGNIKYYEADFANKIFVRLSNDAECKL